MRKDSSSKEGMEPQDVMGFIEGEPCISIVPTDPGFTNKSEGKIVGLNTEDIEINEGLVRFDIIFYVRMKDGISQMIINVEAQKDNPSEYHILNRSIFYVCRLISSQKERDFANTRYDDIKRVVSIWICMNMKENSLDCFQLRQENILGSCKWRGKLDMISIVLIGLSKELPAHDDKYELHRLLGALLSNKLSKNEKLNIIEQEYNIPVEEGLRKEVVSMCNLSQGIVDDAMIEVVLNMQENGFSVEQIALATKKSEDEVRSIIEGKE